MSLFVPVSYDMTGDVMDASQGSNITYDKRCQQCNKTSKKTRQLPECKHELCIKCLSKSLDRRSTWVDDEHDVLPCPKCGVESRKLDISLITKLEKAEKPQKQPRHTKGGNTTPVDRKVLESDNGVDVRATPNAQRLNLSKFYTQTDSSPSMMSTGSDNVLTRSSAMARLGGHRSAVRYSTHENFSGYPTYVSTDSQRCTYFDGDLLQGGHTILSDWRNHVLKVYTKSGIHVCTSEKLDEGPLHVTVMSNRVIVVTFGAKSQQIVFLSFDHQTEKLERIGASNIKGYMYATTKFEDKCVGILEVDDKAPCLALIDVKESTIRSGSFRKLVKNWAIATECPVSSETGLHYCHANKCLYLTNRRTLYCYSADMKLMFKKTYDNVGKDLYMLGSIACDCVQFIYVTSDQCILRVNAITGSLQSTIPTDTDPYHILMGHDKTFLVLVGNQNNTLYCRLQETGNNI